MLLDTSNVTFARGFESVSPATVGPPWMGPMETTPSMPVVGAGVCASANAAIEDRRSANIRKPDRVNVARIPENYGDVLQFTIECRNGSTFSGQRRFDIVVQAFLDIALQFGALSVDEHDWRAVEF